MRILQWTLPVPVTTSTPVVRKACNSHGTVELGSKSWSSSGNGTHASSWLGAAFLATFIVTIWTTSRTRAHFRSSLVYIHLLYPCSLAYSLLFSSRFCFLPFVFLLIFYFPSPDPDALMIGCYDGVSTSLPLQSRGFCLCEF